MPSTYTSLLRLEKQAPGENSDTWGARLNTNTFDMIDEVFGIVSFTGNKTLSTANGSTDEARKLILNITGGTTTTVTIPNIAFARLVRNAGSGAATITTSGGTGATVPAGQVRWVFCNGSGVTYPETDYPDFGSGNLATTGTLAAGNTTITGTASVSGASTLAAVNASGAIAGASSIKSSSASAGIGYAAGAGSTATQTGNKSSSVSINAVCGQITMHNQTVGDAVTSTFTVNNNTVLAGDTITVTHVSGGTGASYICTAHSPIAATSFKISVQNRSGGALGDALVLNYTINRGSSS